MKYKVLSDNLTVDTFLDLLRHSFKTHKITRISKASLYFNPGRKGESTLRVSTEKLLLQETPEEELVDVAF
jgi:hypothetical protein